MEEALVQVRLSPGQQQQQQVGLREMKPELFGRVSGLLHQICQEPAYILEVSRFPRLTAVLRRMWFARRAAAA
jgi:hypothetical protein